MSEKEKLWKEDFLIKSSNILITIGNVLQYLILFLPIKTSFLCLFFQLLKLQMWLSHNYIKRDLGDPNFSCTTAVILLFSQPTSAGYILKLRL